MIVRERSLPSVVGQLQLLVLLCRGWPTTVDLSFVPVTIHVFCLIIVGRTTVVTYKVRATPGDLEPDMSLGVDITIESATANAVAKMIRSVRGQVLQSLCGRQE